MPGRTGLSPCRKEWERRTLPRLELRDTQPCFAFRSFFTKDHLNLWWRPVSDQTRKTSNSPCDFSGKLKHVLICQCRPWRGEGWVLTKVQSWFLEPPGELEGSPPSFSQRWPTLPLQLGSTNLTLPIVAGLSCGGYGRTEWKGGRVHKVCFI